MTIFIENHSFNYEVECLVRLFFPRKKIDVKNTFEKTSDDYIYTKIFGNSVFAEVQINQKCVSLSDTFSPDEQPNQIERKLCVCLYKLLSELTDVFPKWGILTGIRPVKQYAKMRLSNFSREQIQDYFHKDFLVDKQKVKLCELIDKNQAAAYQNNDEQSVSLYVSIPFCPTRCSYCSFVSHAINNKKSQKLIPKYIELLLQELIIISKYTKSLNLKLKTIYIGGGTPTAISAEQLTEIFDCIKANFDLSNVLEYTVEAGRADTITEQKLQAIKNAGVTRISINPQTLNDEILLTIGRKHTATQVIEVFSIARNLGFDNINMDLIAGLPGDTFESFCNSLEKIIKLAPESITVHSLALKRASDFYDTEFGKNSSLVSKMVDFSQNRLVEENYLPYYLYRQKNTLENLENVGYAKKGKECLYNIFMMDEIHSVFAAGANAVTKLVNQKNQLIERIFNFKFHYEYIERIDEIISRKAKISSFYINKKVNIKNKLITMLLIIMLFLSSCSYSQLNIENIMKPPNLTPEQTEIYKQLSTSIDYKKIVLVPPKNGEYKSAIIIKNIDNEKSEEAIVFYQNNKNTTVQKNVRIAVLDKINNHWRYISDLSGELASVDMVSFLKTDKTKTTLLVGFVDPETNAKVLQAYNLKNGIVQRVFKSDYLSMEITDLDYDKSEDIFLINKLNEKSVGRLYIKKGDGFEKKGEVDLEPTSVDYDQIIKGSVKGIKTALFVNSIRPNKQIGTEIIYFENGNLVNGVYNTQNNLFSFTERDSGNIVRKINKLGFYCIPKPIQMQGYADASEVEKLYITNWYSFEKNAFAKTFSSFLNSSDGYMLEFNQKWSELVSAKKLDAQNEVVFFEYKNDLSNISSEIFRIKTTNKTFIDQQKLSGYKLITTKGQLAFWVKISGVVNKDLALSFEQIKANFQVL